MKHPNFIACVLVAAGAIVWFGCSSSSSTTTPPVAPTGSLVVPSSINFGNTRLGVCGDALLGLPRDTNVSIQNTGTDTLRIHSATPQAPQFTVVSLDSAIAPSAYGTMRLQFCPSPPSGSASATLIIASNAAQDSSLTLTLTGNGVPYSPAVGSQFTYTAFNLDVAGSTVGSGYPVTDSIITNGLTYQGQSNVSQSSDSTYYIIGTNGDDSLYAKGFSTYPTTPVTTYFGGGWQELPFATHTPKIYSASETYVNDSDGETITLNVHDTATYVGTTNMTIGVIQYPVSHVHLVETGLYADNKGTNYVVITVESFFSPDLGTIVSQSRVERDVITPLSTGKAGAATGGGIKINLTSFQEH